jgi:hypothetical protein
MSWIPVVNLSPSSLVTFKTARRRLRCGHAQPSGDRGIEPGRQSVEMNLWDGEAAVRTRQVAM